MKITEEEINARLREIRSIENAIRRMSRQAKELDPYIHCSCWNRYPGVHPKCTKFECVRNHSINGTKQVKTVCRKLKEEFRDDG